MSDNANITETGSTAIAADDIGGVKHQRVKVEVGDDGAAADVSDARPMPISPGRPTTQALTWAKIDCASSGDNTLVAGTTAQTIRVFALVYTLASQAAVKFKDSTPTDLSGAMTHGLGGGLALDPIGEPWFVTAAGKGFVANLSAAVQMSGWIGYTKS